MSLRVMTYNVRYFGHALPLRGAASTKKALNRITDTIAQLSRLPHVICLQEVETRSLRSSLSHTRGEGDETQLDAVMKALDRSLTEVGWLHSYRAYYFPAHVYQLSGARLYTTGLAILVRKDLKVLSHNADEPHDITFRRTNGRAAKLKQTRICAHVCVATEGNVTFDVFNTHLSLPSLFSKDLLRLTGRMGYGYNQQHEIESLAKFVEERKRSERYVVVGDFNSLPASPAYNQLLEVSRLRDPFPDAVGKSPEELRQAWPTAGFLSLRMRLDHMFVGRGFEVLDFEDTHPFGLEGPWQGLSDHVPILGCLGLAK